MISARLIKELEKEGFELDFPSYDSNEEKINEILDEDNPRLNLALPLLLKQEFDYKKIRSKHLKKLNKIILITNKIFLKEKIDNDYLKRIIKENKIKEKIKDSEYDYYHDSFKHFEKRKESGNEEKLTKQIKLRGKLNTNQALSKIFSPGKIRIMNKIFNHEALSNTELKYYYRSISPLSRAILNDNLKDYIRLIEANKKYKE